MEDLRWQFLIATFFITQAGTTAASSSILFYWHGVSHEGKPASEAITFSWMWPVVPHIQSDSRILWSSISLEGIDQSHRLFAGDNHQEKVACETTSGLVVAIHASFSIRLSDSLIINICGKNQVILVFFAWKSSREIRTRNFYFLVGCGQLHLWSNQIEGFFNRQ